MCPTGWDVGRCQRERIHSCLPTRSSDCYVEICWHWSSKQKIGPVETVESDLEKWKKYICIKLQRDMLENIPSLASVQGVAMLETVYLFQILQILAVSPSM